MKRVESVSFLVSLSLHAGMLFLIFVIFTTTIETLKPSISEKKITVYLFNETKQQVVRTTQVKNNFTKSKIIEKKEIIKLPVQKTEEDDSNKVEALSKKLDKTENTFITLLHMSIQNKQRYPQSALELEKEGTTRVAFTLHRDGHITSLRIVKSSGSLSLDQAALDAVNQAELSAHTKVYLRQSQDFQIDIVFKLTG